MAVLTASSPASPYPASFSVAQRLHNLKSTSAIFSRVINLKNIALRIPRSQCTRPQRPSSSLLACLPTSSSSSDPPSALKTRLYVSGLSFRTTEDGLRNAFENFGQLVEVNLVMDKVARRPRGFAFLRYATEEESAKAIQGMHGKFLDGRVIFVEVAKARSELRRNPMQNR
ncbi:Organelle RRM domain-containing protein 6, chloroplastic [Linum grandiflorum]